MQYSRHYTSDFYRGRFGDSIKYTSFYCQAHIALRIGQREREREEGGGRRGWCWRDDGGLLRTIKYLQVDVNGKQMSQGCNGLLNRSRVPWTFVVVILVIPFRYWGGWLYLVGFP